VVEIGLSDSTVSFGVSGGPGQCGTEQSLTLEGFDEEDSSPDGDDAGIGSDSLGAGPFPAPHLTSALQVQAPGFQDRGPFIIF